jgi:TolB-like protein/DNA-binding winged helix-turn-helix (wHTH) protein
MPGMEPDHTIYSFGAFTLDVARGTLSRDAVESRLRPKTHAVLRYLVEHPGRLVGKQELLDAVWGSTVVTEGSLTQCVIEIRRALGEAGQRMVRTVPRQGFMLDAAVAVTSLPSQPSAADLVTETDATAAASADRPAWRTRYVAAVVFGLLLLAGFAWWFIAHRGDHLPHDVTEAPPATSTGNSIAVLRFLDLSPDGDQAYFVDGLAEEILHLLAQSPDLKVIARSSSFAFEPGSADLGTVAEQLDVAYVLEGSVRRAAEQLRITVQLIDTSTRAHVWSRTYDHSLSRVIEVQGEVAADVASALAASLQLRPLSNSPEGAAAQDLYLLGRHLFLRRGPGDLDAAERHFQRAVQFDPQHARAWTALAGVYHVRALDVLHDPKYRLEEQRAALEQALAIDPTLGEAHVRLARYFRLKGDTAAAEAAFERARQLAPGDPLVIASLSARALRDGQLDSAIELSSRLVELDPLSVVYRSTLGHMLLAAGRIEAALAQLRRVQALLPDDLRIRTDVALALLLLGRDEEALETLAAAPTDPRADQLRVLVAPPADADSAYARLQVCESAQCRFLLAEIAAHRGEADSAFEFLAAARTLVVESGWRTDFDLTTETALSPFLKSLRPDARWQALRVTPPDS